MKKKDIKLPKNMIIVCTVIAAILFLQQRLSANQPTNIYSSQKLSLRPPFNANRELTAKITLGAVGDILIHPPVYQDAFNGVEYNFDPMFEKVKPLLKKPDILTANQESTLGGVELGLSGYPLFNSPHQVANALVDAGVDIVSTANNHALDKGEKGIYSESAYLDQLGLPHVGSYSNEIDRQKLRIMNKNGIRIAFIAYTYGTNGIPLPKGKEFLVNIIDKNTMKSEIARAKSNADVVVMSLHWGNEYERIPTNEQRDVAQFLANEGVDIIFGSHPHVLQPMEWIKTKDGRKTFVIYSLGNFISGQQGDYKDIGGLATIDITKKITKKGCKIILSNPTFTPTYVTSQQNKSYRIVPLVKARNYGLTSAKAKYDEIKHHMVKWLQ
ncbi:CapA family protein [Neobacillus vireti]|uniref:CapA family protein n=1 Tax=Neobacillus vireti TaxID=220686 RepID=UPI00300031FF